jgi:uncharacterized protein involved in exopolysaccharide biosynthesis
MSENATNHDSPEDDEISLLDLAIVLTKHKKLILGLPFGAAVVAAGISLLMPNIYTGTTRILPLQQSASAASAASALLEAARQHPRARLHLVSLDIPAALDIPTEITVHAAWD